MGFDFLRVAGPVDILAVKGLFSTFVRNLPVLLEAKCEDSFVVIWPLQPGTPAQGEYCLTKPYHIHLQLPRSQFFDVCRG